MTGATPRVSVIIPAYNAAAFIAEALASASAQTLAGIEILVIDDASTDATLAIAATAAEADPRIRLLRQPVNSGPSAARNRGFDEARGDWLALLDADDAYAPDRLAALVALAEREGADLCSDNLLLVAEQPMKMATAMIPSSLLAQPRPLPLAEFLTRNVADPGYPGVNFGFLKPILRSAFVNANSLRYDERVRFAEDFAFYVACFRAGANWWMAPQPSYRYRIRADSLTQVQTVHDLGILRTRLATMLAEATAAGDSTLTPILRRHRRVVDRCYYYRSFTDKVKAKSLEDALRELFSSPWATLLIGEESLRQLPIILRKIVVGGYRHGKIH